MLIYKHLGVYWDEFTSGNDEFLRVLITAQSDSVNSLVGEIIREKYAVRVDALNKTAFEGRWREIERWLLHDGWVIEDGQLVRLTPEAEEATSVRDRLIEELKSSDLDNDGAIRKCIEESAKSFMAEPPDYNEATTKVRIALETIARRTATKVADTKGGVAYPEDSWSKALAFLRKADVLELEEEQMMVRVYTFISRGAHVPVGITGEEWARLARTFGLSSSYFILKKYEAARHAPLSQ